MKSKTEAERSFFMNWAEEKENEGMRLLLGRAFQIIAAEAGTTFEEIERRVLRETAA